MGNLPTYQVHQLCKNQISGSATNKIFLWPSAICAQIREPDIRLLQPDFIACFLSRDLSGCPTWYLVPVLRPNLIFGSCVKLDSLTVGWHRQRTGFLVHVVHVGNLGIGSIQELMRTKTSWSSVWTAQLKERMPGACLPRKLIVAINFLGKQAPGTCGFATIWTSQTRTAITFSVVHQTSFQEQFRKAWKMREASTTSNYLTLQLKWRIVSSVTSTEHSSFCVVTALTQYLQYQATASYSVYKTLVIVVLLDPQKFTIVHLKPSLLWSLDYTSATCRLRQYTCCSSWTGQCQEKLAHSSSLLLQPSSASMAKACRDTVALHNRYNHCLYQLRF